MFFSAGIRPSLKRAVESPSNKGFVSSFSERSNILCLSSRRLQKIAEAAANDPTFDGKLPDVQRIVQTARKHGGNPLAPRQ